MDALETMVDEIERVLAAISISDTQDPDATGFRLTDRISGTDDFAQGNAHLGVSVHVDSTINTDRDRDAETAWVEDTVRVRLSYQLNPHAQKDTRDVAYGLERSIRLAITAMRDGANWNPSYRNSERTLDGGWLTIDQSFAFTRFAEVAGG